MDRAGRKRARAKAFFIQRRDEKIRNYHKNLKEHAYQPWVSNIKPLTLTTKNPSDVPLSKGGVEGSLECLYFAQLNMTAMTTDDPDHTYALDATAHLASYELLQSSCDYFLKIAYGESWSSSNQAPRITDLIEALHQYIQLHNDKVREFSKWEIRAFKNMGNEVSLPISITQTIGTGAIHGAVNSDSLVAYMDGQVSDAEKWRFEVSKSDFGWQLSALRAGQFYGLTVAPARDQVERLKSDIEKLAPTRNEKIEPLRKEASLIIAGHEILIHNLQIVIKEINDGIFRGRCPTEDTFASEK